MTFTEAIEWALQRKAAVIAEQAASLRLQEDLRMQIAHVTGATLEKLEKKLKAEDSRYVLLLRAEKSWQKLADIWGRGEKARLKVSFSGGKTSGYMAKRIKKELSHLFVLVFVFSNTSREHETTLIFVDACDKAFELDVDWVEAVVMHGERAASGHRVVKFETASRLEHGDWNPNGWPTPFLEVVKKYGIPNADFEPCNRELKLNTMDSYMESIGWDDYFTAIGIRADEGHRLDEKAGAFQIIYFLAHLWRTDKQDVADFWEDQPFQLDLPEHLGNCVDCHKKMDLKLFNAYADMPEVFEFDKRIEKEYPWHGAPYHGVPTEGGRPRVRWRENRNTEQLLAKGEALGVRPHIRIREMRSMATRQQGLDFEGGCSESCEAYPLEMLK